MPFVATALRMSSGAIVWAVHFAVIYGYTGLACARGWADTVPWVLGIATAAAVLATLLIIASGYRDRARFESWMTYAIGGAALVAIAWEALPVLIVTTCG